MTPFLITQLLALFFAQDTVVKVPESRSVFAELRESGVRVETERAILWFEPEQLTSEEREQFASLVDQGIGHLQEFLGAPVTGRRIQYFVSSRIATSYSNSRAVFLPLARVKEHRAPYLHESAHIIAPCEDCPMWFSEGIASYVQSWISENRGGYDGVVFARHGNGGIHRDATRWLNDERGQTVLPFVARHGEPPDIWNDRSNVAAPFYVMSQSLVKFLVDKTGMENIRSLFAARDFEAQMLEATGKSSEQWKEAWLAALR